MKRAFNATFQWFTGLLLRDMGSYCIVVFFNYLFQIFFGPCSSASPIQREEARTDKLQFFITKLYNNLILLIQKDGEIYNRLICTGIFVLFFSHAFKYLSVEVWLWF